MTKDDVIEALEALQKSGDTEASHGEADEILCNFLRALGHGDVADAFDAIEKWYA